MALPIILDCDPGHDDAIALVLALASPELEVKAVTSSAGNQTPDKTLRNVLRMLTLLNRTDIPVAGGAIKPLMRELIIADNVHGESGLDGPALPEPGFAPQNCTAVELMANVLRESHEPVTLVATGPQTNVALLLNSHPDVARRNFSHRNALNYAPQQESEKQLLRTVQIKTPRCLSHSNDEAGNLR